MAPATKESTRQQRLQALGHLNAALEEFEESRSQDAIDLNTVRARIQAANIAYGRFVSWHDKFLDFHFDKAPRVEELEESTAAFKEINTAKAQFLALKRAHSGLEPSVPLAENAAADVNPEKNPDDPNLRSTFGQASHREDGKGGVRGKGRSKRSDAGGNGPRKGNVDGDRDQRREIRCMSFPNGLYSCPNFEKMNVTGRWELIKETYLRPLCVSKRVHASDTEKCVPHRCLECPRLHNHAVHCTFFRMGYSDEITVLSASRHDNARRQNRSPRDRSLTTQENDGNGCSETPSDLDLCTLKLQEVPVTRKPRTDPCEVSVNWISDIRHFGPGDGLEDNARIESADMCLGIRPMTAQVGANVFDKPDGDRKLARRVRALLDSAAWGDRKFARRVRALLDSAAWRSPVPQELGRKLGFDHGAADICELSTFYDPQRVERPSRSTTSRPSQTINRMVRACSVCLAPPPRDSTRYTVIEMRTCSPLSGTLIYSLMRRGLFGLPPFL